MSDNLLQEKPLYITSALQANDKERSLDHLNLLPYAEALTKFIETADTPMTVGLQGDWGSGKTSMLNMLRGDESNRKSGLLTSTQCLVINFETWSYSQFNDRQRLPMACLYALTEKLGDALKKEKLLNDKTEDTFKKTTGKLTSVLKKSFANASIGVMGINIPVGKAISEASAEQDQQDEEKLDDLSQQMIEFRESFSELVDLWVDSDKKKSNRRVVICVDDLDRIEPIVALELLESIKNFLDVEGCVFILAVDYEIVQEGMKKKLGGDVQKTTGKSFFDKIIQLPFNMPKSSYNIQNYLKKLIVEAQFVNTSLLIKNDLKFLEEITVCSIGGNPRSIKRVMNYARLLNIIRDENKDRKNTFTPLDSKILYSLICMQIAWPEVFAHFMAEPTSETMQNLENWDYLDKTPELKPLFDRVRDVEGLKNNISGFIDTLFSEIDVDGDGTLSQKEFEPVQKVLSMAKFTSVEMKVRPRDEFFETASANAKKSKDPAHLEFLNRVYLKSKIFTSSEIKYRPAGKRYVTLVYKRRQLGSLVTLSRNPIVVRLNGHADTISVAAQDILGDKLKFIDCSEYVRDFAEGEANLTGFGDAIVDIKKLIDGDEETKLDDLTRIKVFNAIVTATEKIFD